MKIKILIVDDEEGILFILKRWIEFLENEKYEIEVLTTTSSLKAIEIIENNKIDILLTDIIMPEMSGIDLLKKTKKINPFTQVIIMTAYTTIDRALECYSAGANDFLMKPFENMENLINIISFTIDKIQRWEKIIKKSIKK